jgi:hypothetical protein
MSRALPWFRFYVEVLDDPKVQLLPVHLRWTWVSMLCLASQANGKLPPVQHIAFRLRMSVCEVETQMDELILAGLVDIQPDGSRVMHNWQARQYSSDDCKERVRRFRERKKLGNVTSTVTETPPDTDSDTDTDKELVSSLTRDDESEGKEQELHIDFGKGKKGGVSPKLRARAEGLGLNVEALLAKTRAKNPDSPNGYFRALCRTELTQMLPTATNDLLDAALSNNDAAFASVCSLIISANAGTRVLQ